MNLLDLITSKNWHERNKCPCRKKHLLAPKPIAPDGPPNTGKQTKLLRKALDKLVELEGTQDELEFEKAKIQVEKLTSEEISNYRVLYEKYLALMSGWSSEVCGSCGVSIMAISSLGCGMCVSEDLQELINETSYS